jgi:hypothetical protein
MARRGEGASSYVTPGATPPAGMDRRQELDAGAFKLAATAGVWLLV